MLQQKRGYGLDGFVTAGVVTPWIPKGNSYLRIWNRQEAW